MFYSFGKKFKLNFNLKDLKKYKKYNKIILIGMGGSALASEAIFHFLKSKIKKEFIFIKNLDKREIDFHFKNKKFKNALFLLISKSGNTIETLSIIENLKKANLNKNNSLVITEKKRSQLSEYAKANNINIIYHRNFIGGRYSVFSETGIVPALLMGLDDKKLKKHTLEFLKKNNKTLKKNVLKLSQVYSSKKIH